MRIDDVPEWDSQWEGLDPRFRLYLFSDGSSVSTHDIFDANVHEAFEAAHMMSQGDTVLWSLALVVDDSGHGRGLRWLSGSDYNGAPLNAVEWRARAVMQNRYLAAVTRAGREARLPDGRRVIRMFCDGTTGWPLWESFTDHYVVGPAELSISTELGADLTAWSERFCTRHEDDPLPEGGMQEGTALAGRLRDEVAHEAEVRPEFLY